MEHTIAESKDKRAKLDDGDTYSGAKTRPISGPESTAEVVTDAVPLALKVAVVRHLSRVKRSDEIVRKLFKNEA